MSQSNEKSLREIQKEVGEWSVKTFGSESVSKFTGQKLYSQNALTGLVEEVGELNHVTICMHQGRRGYDPTTPAGLEQYVIDRNDAVADILIFLCDYAHREGIDLQKLLNDTWTEIVRHRTVENWAEHTHKPSATPAEPAGDAFDFHKLLPSEAAQVIQVAVSSKQWKVDQYLQLVPTDREDIAYNWAGIWKEYPNPNNSNQLIRVPHWIQRRMIEMGLLKENGTPLLPKTNLELKSEELYQTGHGWAEPPEETERPSPSVPLEAVGVINPDYPTRCTKCRRPIHKSNSVGMCPDCYNKQAIAAGK